MDHQNDHQAQQKAAAARSETPLDKVLKAPANQSCADCGAKYASERFHVSKMLTGIRVFFFFFV